MRRVTLRDGSQIAIRPIEPADRDALAEGLRRLSPESRYRRFFASVTDLSARDLDYLTRVDHHDHEALVALDADTGGGRGGARAPLRAPRRRRRRAGDGGGRRLAGARRGHRAARRARRPRARGG